MKLSLERADEFNADFEEQYRWYLEQAGEEIAERFLRAVAATLPLLAEQPNLGRRRKFRHPKLRWSSLLSSRTTVSEPSDFLPGQEGYFRDLAFDARGTGFAAPAD